MFTVGTEWFDKKFFVKIIKYAAIAFPVAGFIAYFVVDGKNPTAIGYAVSLLVAFVVICAAVDFIILLFKQLVALGGVVLTIFCGLLSLVAFAFLYDMLAPVLSPVLSSLFGLNLPLINLKELLTVNLPFLPL